MSDEQTTTVWKAVKAAALRRLKEIAQGSQFSADELRKITSQIQEADHHLKLTDTMNTGDFPNLNEPATQANLARLLGVARSTIHGHHEAGVFTEGAVLGVWLREYLNKLRLEASGRANEHDEEMREAILDEKRAKAYNLKLDAAQKAEILVNRDLVLQELQPAIQHIKTTMEAAGGRIASALSAQHGIPVDKRLIENEFRTALTEMADYGVKEK